MSEGPSLTVPVTFKVKLLPNDKQATCLSRHAGARRYVYNWALAEHTKAWEEEHKSLSAYDQGIILTQLKKTAEYQWLNEISASVLEHSIEDLGQSFEDFYRRCKDPTIIEKGYPTFRKKHLTKTTFTVRGAVKLKDNGKYLQIPIVGKVKLAQIDYIPQGRIKNATVNFKCNEWWVFCVVETEFKLPELTDNILGIDPGLASLATTSDGQIFDNPHFHKKEAKKLKRLDRKIDRRKKAGGSNREKAKLQKAKLERKVARKRKNYTNEMTTDLVKTKPKLVVYEGSNVPGMMKNHHVASSLQDAAFGIIGRQLEYKCQRSGIRFLRASMWYPSSKCCSSCGFHKKNLKWDDRVFKCPNCSLEIDRDLNAALNFKYYGIKWLEIESTGGVSGINAQGDRRLQCIIRAYAKFLADEAKKKAKASRKHSARRRVENPTLSSSSKIRTVL